MVLKGCAQTGFFPYLKKNGLTALLCASSFVFPDPTIKHGKSCQYKMGENEKIFVKGCFGTECLCSLKMFQKNAVAVTW